MEWYKAAERFTDALASSDPTPGGGAAAAMAGAMGCALAMMAVETTLKRKATPQDVKTKLEPGLKKLASLREQLKSYIQLDGDAYAAFLAAKKLPKENPTREQAVQDALLFAARVPSDTATTALTCLREADALKELVAPVILSDVYCAQHLLKACIRCSVESIKANLEFITHADQKQKLEQQVSNFLKSC